MAKKSSAALLGIGAVLVAIGLVGGLTALTVSYRVDHRRPYNGDEHGSVEVITPYDDNSTLPEFPDIDTNASGPEADDGELHDARDIDVSYQFQEGYWAISQTEHLDAYDMNVNCDFSVRYPVLTGDLKHLDSINALLRSTAMETVHTYYEDPDADTVKFVKKITEDAQDFITTGADAYLMSQVDYAVTYNDENLISVCFSDSFCAGSLLAQFIELRTVNINLQTGEVYVLDDALNVNESIATSFVDNLVQTSGVDENQDGVIEDSECSTVVLAGRDALIEALQGRGELAEKRIRTCLFIDGNGKPNLGVNYWVSGDDAFVRGWWDVTISDEQLKEAAKECELWDLLPESE